ERRDADDVHAGRETEDPVDAAVVRSRVDERWDGSGELNPAVDAFDRDVRVDDRLAVGVRDAAGDDAAGLEREVDAVDPVAAFADRRGRAVELHAIVVGAETRSHGADAVAARRQTLDRVRTVRAGP